MFQSSLLVYLLISTSAGGDPVKASLEVLRFSYFFFKALTGRLAASHLDRAYHYTMRGCFDVTCLSENRARPAALTANSQRGSNLIGAGGI